jgi:hypothetical protein
MIAVDPYMLVGYDAYYPSGSGAKQHSFKRQDEFDLLYDRTKNLLNKYGDRVSLIRKTSIDAGKLVNDESLDFVFIDANHVYDYVKSDILLWSKKVKIGGYIIGHDYNKNDVDTLGICRAVHDLFDDKEINLGSDSCWWVIKTKEVLEE